MLLIRCASVALVLALALPLTSCDSAHGLGARRTDEVQQWQPTQNPPENQLVPVYSPAKDLEELRHHNGAGMRTTWEVTDPVITPDGTMWLRQDARAGELDNQDLDEHDSRGQALVALHPDGSGEIVATPYSLGKGSAVEPVCSGPDGTVYAAHDTQLVAREPDGDWHAVTAETTIDDLAQGNPRRLRGDGGPAAKAVLTAIFGCVVEPDGDLLIAEYCAIRRIGSDGVITTVAGRDTEPDTFAWGCAQAADLETTTPSAGPLVLRGPALSTDLPWLGSLALGPDGRVWFTSLLGVRTLVPQPDGTYAVRTVQTVNHGPKKGVDWPPEGDNRKEVEDVQPLPDGHVLLVVGDELWDIDSDGVLRPAGLDGQFGKGLALGRGLLYSTGPLNEPMVHGLRVSRIR